MKPLFSENVRKRILAEVTPTQKEIEQQKAVIDSLRTALSNHPNSERFSFTFIEAQGSTGRKQTQLRNSADIDLFVGLRPQEYSSLLEKPPQDRHQDLDKLFNDLVQEWFEPAVSGLDTSNIQRAYSQHPYLSLNMGSLEIDILGCFDIDSETLSNSGPITAVDRTVHHTNFVADRLTDKKRDDIRILKSFVRACHAYGDKCAVGRMGITGVSLELLVIITDTLNQAFESLKMVAETPIDPLNRTKQELRKNPAFRDDYIILIDPTDHQRNIASSFTPRAYEWVRYRIERLYQASRQGQDDMVVEIVRESPIPSQELPGWLRKHSLTREFKSDRTRHYTILRDKLYRVAKKVQTSLQTERTGETRFGETLVEIYFKEPYYALGILIEQPEISESYVRRGPSTDLVEACEEFRKKHPAVDERDGFLWTTEQREWRNPEKLIDNVLKDNPVDGLNLTNSTGDMSKKILNVLYRYILPIEPSFLGKITKNKEGLAEIPW